VKTDKIEMELNAKGKSWKTVVAQEIKELKAGDGWGPFIPQFKVLDSDFDLEPQEVVRVKISIIVNFRELALYGGEFPHQAGGEITAELKSIRSPEPLDYVRKILSFVNANLWIIPVALSVSVAILIQIKFKKTIRL
jgi:hypothetical protein